MIWSNRSIDKCLCDTWAGDCWAPSWVTEQAPAKVLSLTGLFSTPEISVVVVIDRLRPRAIPTETYYKLLSIFSLQPKHRSQSLLIGYDRDPDYDPDRLRPGKILDHYWIVYSKISVVVVIDRYRQRPITTQWLSWVLIENNYNRLQPSIQLEINNDPDR